ncbi:MAG: DNA/RNA non-specific endonuclease, partial [Bacteroidales bacterium]|nr:DNA/RNA non-specific endonuclease [Bacteroidales bacterium]
LTSSHTSGSATNGSWDYNPNVDRDYQINVASNSYGTNYNAGTYSRGHQVPSADRKDDSTKRKQLYYLTNQTPQIQNGFNGTIWSALENGVRALVSNTDTVYVVTGASFRKVGGNETIKYLSAAKDGVSPAQVPVPNYYWKVLLKVKRTGDAVTSASAIGFWLDHKVYSNNDYTPYAVSVDTIEQYTGFDFFTNLPDTLEPNAEKNTSWSSFQNF